MRKLILILEKNVSCLIIFFCKNTGMSLVKFLLSGIMCFAVAFCHGQKIEKIIALNSGLFSFYGKSAESTSSINYNEISLDGYTNNPYGTGRDLCIGLSVMIKKVTSKNFLFGIDLGYEKLQSSVRITQISLSSANMNRSIATHGKSRFKFNSINVFPFLGYRISNAKMKTDLSLGMEMGYLISAKDVGYASGFLEVYRISHERSTINFDIRPRVQFTLNYKNFGFYTGYSLGLANFMSGYIDGVNDCYSNIIRFGVAYKIN